LAALRCPRARTSGPGFSFVEPWSATGSTKVFRILPDDWFIGLPVPGYEIHWIASALAVEYITLLRSVSWKLAGTTIQCLCEKAIPRRKREIAGGPD